MTWRYNAQQVQGASVFTPSMLSNNSPSISAFFERGLTDKFPKPSFRLLKTSMGIFPKIEIPSFWKNFCELSSEVFGWHLSERRLCGEEEG